MIPSSVTYFYEAHLRMYNREQKPSPPTGSNEQERMHAQRAELTRAAHEILTRWGLSEEQIAALVEHTSQFEYGNCKEKIIRLASTPAELFLYEGEACINIPHFLDVNGQFSGQTGNIASHWIIKLHSSGLIEEINASLPTNKRIVPSSNFGTTSTHFVTPEHSHVWNSLSLMEEGSQVEEVYIDASFQIICTPQESRYKRDGKVTNPKKIGFPENFPLKITSVILVPQTTGNRLARRILHPNEKLQWRGLTNRGAELGISEQKSHIFSLYFAQVNHDERGQLRPVLVATTVDGSTLEFLLTKDGVVLEKLPQTKNSALLEEITELLHEAEKIQFIQSEPTMNNIEWEL